MQGGERRLPRHVQGLQRQQGRQAVGSPVGAGLSNGEADLDAVEARADHRALTGQGKALQAGVGGGRGAEGDDVEAPLQGRLGQQFEPRVVGVEHREAARLQPLEDLGLGPGDAHLAVGEVLDVDGADHGDHRHMGGDLARQGPDLAGVVHADLEHGPGCVGGHTGEGKRDADMVVVGLDRVVAGPGQPQPGGDGLGDAGLADRAGDGGAPGAGRALAGGRAQGLQGDEGVGDVDRRIGGRARDQGAGRALAEGHIEELVPVALAGQGDEQVAGLQRAGVDGHAGGGEGRVAQTARAGGDFQRGPERITHGPAPGLYGSRSRRRRGGRPRRWSGPARGPCRRSPARRRRAAARPRRG